PQGVADQFMDKHWVFLPEFWVDPCSFSVFSQLGLAVKAYVEDSKSSQDQEENPNRHQDRAFLLLGLPLNRDVVAKIAYRCWPGRGRWPRCNRRTLCLGP